MKTLHSTLASLIATFCLLAVMSGCKSSTSPSSTTVVIPGVGSTFTFFEVTRNSNNVQTGSDSTP